MVSDVLRALPRGPQVAIGQLMLLFAWTACSGGDAGQGVREGQKGAANGAAGTSAGQGDGAAGSSGFGNSGLKPGEVTGGASGAAGEPNFIDGGMCEVGKFCGPKNPDDDDCGSLTLETDVEINLVPGNLLVIFDQSGSMDQEWGGAGSKLASAQNAVVQAITPLQDVLNVGAIFFPTTRCGFGAPVGSAVQPIDGPNQIPFQPAPDFLTAWQQHWASRTADLAIGTPMQEAFDRADVAIANANITGELIVVAFTDGEPNCFPDPAITGVPTMVEPERVADWLSTRSIKTHMVGLPGADGVTILNQVAQSGGTMQYLLPDDPAQLQMLLSEVVKETVKMGFDSCSMTLDPPAELPDKLHVVVEDIVNGESDVPRDLQGGGWAISLDGSQVTLQGNVCTAALEGRFTSIRFEYGCVELPPLPPIILE